MGISSICSLNGPEAFLGIDTIVGDITKYEDPISEAERASLACTLAESLLQPVKANIIKIGDDQYAATVQENWSRDCWLQPQCILQPSNTAQVQLIMEIITHTSARFAIRGRGNNPNRGWAGIGENGLLLDLSSLNKLELQDANSTMVVGAGNKWIDVYKQLEGTKRTILGARMPNVGVGGVLLGCGIPNFASEFGLACDYIRRMEVVLGNGSVVLVNEDLHADLWWALRGGGPNFGMNHSARSQASFGYLNIVWQQWVSFMVLVLLAGLPEATSAIALIDSIKMYLFAKSPPLTFLTGIITEFELETVPVDRIWFEARIYAPSENRKLLEAVYKYQQAAEKDDSASLAFSLSNDHTFVAFVYSKPAHRPAVFDMFYNITFVKTFIDSSIGSQYDLVTAFASVLGDEKPSKYVLSFCNNGRSITACRYHDLGSGLARVPGYGS